MKATESSPSRGSTDNKDLNDSGSNLSGYGYDSFGRIAHHRWKDSGGTLLAGWAYDYDRVGKPEPTRRRSARAKPAALSEAKARSHAERNRLIEVEENQSGTWTKIAQYKYDGKTRRVLKAVTNKGDLNGTTRFLWGGTSDWQALEERDESGNLVARYTYAPGYLDAVARQQRDLNADGDFADSNEVVWYHSNIIYSVCALSNSSGSVVERYRYDAYGAATVLDADGSDDADGVSDIENPYRFTARRLEAASGLMQYRHRYYDAAHGRFVSRDPAGYRDAFNLYGYVTQRPTSATDPMGLTGDVPLPPLTPGYGFGKWKKHDWQYVTAYPKRVIPYAGATTRAPNARPAKAETVDCLIKRQDARGDVVEVGGRKMWRLRRRWEYKKVEVNLEECARETNKPVRLPTVIPVEDWKIRKYIPMLENLPGAPPGLEVKIAFYYHFYIGKQDYDPRRCAKGKPCQVNTYRKEDIVTGRWSWTRSMSIRCPKGWLDDQAWQKALKRGVTEKWPVPSRADACCRWYLKHKTGLVPK